MDYEILKQGIKMYNKIADLKKVKKNLESIMDKKDFENLVISLSKIGKDDWNSKSEVFDVSEFPDFFDATVMAYYALVINKISELEMDLMKL